MKIKISVFIIGIIILISTMVISTQYAIIRAGYQYSIVHPSGSDIRFIGFDSTSYETGDGELVLRVNTSLSAGGVNSSRSVIELYFGTLKATTNTTYSGAFGIVNEEPFPVNITNISVVSSGDDYLQIWLHSTPNVNAGSADPGTSVFMWNQGTALTASSTCAWKLGAGDGNPSNMSSGPGSDINNPWDTTSNVRYTTDTTSAVNGTSDFVWAQISINLTSAPDYPDPHNNYIFINFESSTL